MFLRKSRIEPLPVTMSAVRMGERVLQIGVDDPALASAIAAKVGLSGNAAIAVTDDRDAARAHGAAAHAGVRGCTVRACRLAIVSHCDRGITTESDLRRNRTRHRWIIDADLQNTLTHAHGAHRDGQRLDAGFAQKHVIFNMV